MKIAATNSFLPFIWREKVNRLYLWIALGGTIIQFILFKLLYPYPDFFSDSYSYLFAAYADLDVSIWPIGYSKFLRVFHTMTHSDMALIAFQYFFLETAALYFFFTVLYFYRPVRANRVFLCLFLFFNPLFLYLSNYVNSDPLFVALSLFWFTQLIWIINRPRIYQIWVQAILLFLCFTIRNNAYYYPLIAMIAFFLSRQSLRIKLLGMALPFILIIPFILHTRNVAYKMTGTKQFSLFTGWQLANNALYMYQDLLVDKEDLPSPQARQLDSLTKQFYKRVVPEFHDRLEDYVGNFFIRQPEAPLKQYMIRHYKITDEYSSIVAWGKASAVFEDYGSTLIKQNPVAYVREYMWLNTKNYFLPPLEKLEVYNLGEDSVGEIAKFWFHYKSLRVTAISKGLQGVLLFVFPSLFLLLNGYLLLWGIQFLVRRRYKTSSPAFNRMALITGSFLVANFCFCVFATIIVFRYQVFPLMISFFVTLFVLEWSDKKALQKNSTTSVVRETKLNYNSSL